MLKRTLIMGVLALGFGIALAEDPNTAPAKPLVFGSQLMTQQERAVHRNKLRAATTPEEKAKLRAEFHESMKLRAQQLGVAIPETPPARGGGVGPGPGGGMGMGPGGGRNR